MDVGGKMTFHADGRAAAADVARRREQLLQGEKLALLVARRAGGHLQVDLVLAGDDADEMPRPVAAQNDGLEHLLDVFAQARRHVHGAEVALVDGVGNQFVGNARSVEQAGSVGLVGLVAHGCMVYRIITACKDARDTPCKGVRRPLARGMTAPHARGLPVSLARGSAGVPAGASRSSSSLRKPAV